MTLLRTARNWFTERTSTISASGVPIPGTRLSEGDVPTEETFKRLVDSFTSVLSPEDSAQNDQQGLVRTVTGAAAKSASFPDDGFTYAAQVKNLPQMLDISQNIADFSGKAILAELTPNEDRNVYTSRFSEDFVTWLSNTISSLNTSVSSISSAVSTLGARVEKNELDISAALSNIANIQSNLSSAQADILTLSNRVSSVESELSTLTSRVDALESSGGASVSTNLVGQIITMPVPVSPSSEYMPLNGQAISRATFSVLFGKIGTAYGAGNGSSTFNLPNTSGKSVRGAIPGDVKFGQGVSGGSDSVTISASNLPTHQHNNGGEAIIKTFDTAGTSPATAVAGDASSTEIDDNLGLTGSTGDNTPSGAALDITNPYLSLFHFIKVV